MKLLIVLLLSISTVLACWPMQFCEIYAPSKQLWNTWKRIHNMSFSEEQDISNLNKFNKDIYRLNTYNLQNNITKCMNIDQLSHLSSEELIDLNEYSYRKFFPFRDQFIGNTEDPLVINTDDTSFTNTEDTSVNNSNDLIVEHRDDLMSHKEINDDCVYPSDGIVFNIAAYQVCRLLKLLNNNYLKYFK